MPDLSNIIVNPVMASSSTTSCQPQTLDCKWNHRLRFPIANRLHTCSKKKKEKKEKEGKGKMLMEHLREWVEKRVKDGVREMECDLPFLNNAKVKAECRLCSRYIYPGEEVICSVRTCREPYHRTCSKQHIRKHPSKEFKCPQHACFLCKMLPSWRCVRCTIAWDDKCAPWPDEVLRFGNRDGVCWKHPIDWREANEHLDLTSNLEEAFWRLPLPYIEEEFMLGSSILNDVAENKNDPGSYVHIRRNVYLIKKKRNGAEADVGCMKCGAGSTCMGDCECRGLSVSCSKACHCSDMCTNRPFRKEKKIKVVKTKLCGWGVVALEAIERGEFVIEYIGEVIDDASCEQRLWDMKRRGDQNFYMCELRKDFTIDATYKGNSARFLNHSCNPNCKLEKWQVDGETRVGIFATRSIEVGEPLTYDYRFVQFGPMVKCLCGAQNCQGFLGSKRKITQFPCWGCKRKRTVAVRT